MTLENLLNRIENAPTIDFGETFNKAIHLYQKVWLQGLLLVILSSLSFMGIYMICIVPMMASSFVLDGPVNENSGALSYAILALLFVLYLVVILAALIASLGLYAAFFRITRVKDRNEHQELGVNFGMFFKKQYLKKLSLFSLSYFGIMMLAYILCFFPILYVCIPLQFSLIIFAFHPDWSINDIFTAAFKLGNKKWGVAFALTLVSAILAYIVGILACFIGIYATVSFIMLPSYIIYKEVVGFSEVEDAIAQIGNS